MLQHLVLVFRSIATKKIGANIASIKMQYLVWRDNSAAGLLAAKALKWIAFNENTMCLK